MGLDAKKRRTGIIVPLGITAAMIFMCGDFIPLSLRPLDYLDMPYPHVLRYTHVIVPLLALGVWLASKRSTNTQGAGIRSCEHAGQASA